MITTPRESFAQSSALGGFVFNEKERLKAESVSKYGTALSFREFFVAHEFAANEISPANALKNIRQTVKGWP
jgi:hypothetical protein